MGDQIGNFRPRSFHCPKPETDPWCSLDKEPLCGDGVINRVAEECDTADFGGETCSSLGLGSGEISCTGDCKVSCNGETTPPGGEEPPPEPPSSSPFILSQVNIIENHKRGETGCPQKIAEISVTNTSSEVQEVRTRSNAEGTFVVEPEIVTNAPGESVVVTVTYTCSPPVTVTSSIEIEVTGVDSNVSSTAVVPTVINVS